ncbi:hypothetical protein JW756_00635 [Candidatus Woesearchaeota archaeon]|nr:hypothetical protein [Candidatus Woesearchaeota archaeon]
MMATPMHHPGAGDRKRRGVVTKEFIVGLLSIALGGYNLAANFGYIQKFVEIPQIVGNIILVIAGLILWATAYKLWRYKWHASRFI